MMSIAPPDAGISKKVRVLLIDDDEDEFVLTSALLSECEGLTFDVDWSPSFADGLADLLEGRHDLYLLDYRLGENSGIDLLRKAREGGALSPVIMLTGQGSRALDIQAMGLGASDYLVKNDFTPIEIERAIRYALERHRLEELLKEKTKRELDAKNQLLSHVSHELRSPLNVIYQFVSLVSDGIGGPVSEQQREYLDVALQNIGQLTRLIEDLLDAARAEAGKLSIRPEKMSIAPIVAEVVEGRQRSATGKGLELSAVFGDESVTVYADPVRVRQVLSNLVENAIKFTSAGSITVSIAPDWEFRSVEVAVQDTGRGIEDEKLERVFERLHQEHDTSLASRNGLGLGLHICQELVARLGGRLWVESEVGRGSTFRFDLPMCPLRAGLQSLLAAGKAGERTLVALAPLETSERDNRAEWPTREDLRQRIAGLIRPGADSILPHVDQPEIRDIVFVVAETTQEGAQTMAARLVADLAPRSEYRLAVVTRSLPNARKAADGGSGGLTREVGQVLAEIMDELKQRRRNGNVEQDSDHR